MIFDNIFDNIPDNIFKLYNDNFTIFDLFLYYNIIICLKDSLTMLLLLYL